MGATPMAWIIPQFFTDEGVMASGYQLFSYAQNTTTKQNTYEDSDLTVANSNPIVLDQYGRAPIFLSLSGYKFVLATPTASDPPAPGDIIWTADYVPAYATLASNFDISGVAGEDTDINHNVVYLSDGNDGKTPGLWDLTNALVPASSSQAITIGVAVAPILLGETGTIRIAGKAEGFTSFALTPGAVYYLSDVSLGEVTGTEPAIPMVLGKADSVSTMIIEPNWGAAGASNRGILTSLAQTIGGLKTFAIQPSTYIGTNATLLAKLGGVYFTDTTAHNVGNSQTDAVLSSTEIPADMLDADGKAIELWFGSDVAVGGTTLKQTKIDVNGTINDYSNYANGGFGWWIRATLTRTSSTTATMVSIALPGDTPIGNGNNIAFYALTGLDFTTSMALRTLATTGANDTISQSFCVVRALG